MKHKLFTSILFATSILLTGCTSTANLSVASPFRQSIFNETVGGIKTKAEYQDSNGNKGLLLYGYEEGASINFGCSYNGAFKASMRPTTNDFGSLDLKEFSLLFKDKASGEQFSIKVFIYSNYYYAAVCYNGQLAGVNYYDTAWATGRQHGFSAIANEEGRYTKLDNKTSIDLYFDPVTMVVQAKASDGVIRNIWDFKQEYNDGKQLTNNLPSFDEYDISVIFDKVSANGCADLLVSSFANYDLTSSSLANVSPIINTNIKTKAIIGQNYVIPEPTIASPTSGELNPNDISINVYKDDGSKVTLNNGGFIPNEEKDYYAYYSYNKDGLSASTYAKIKTVKEDESSLEFSEPYFETVLGLNSKIIVPDVQILTNLGTKSSSFDCEVTVKRDGNVFEGIVNAKTGSQITLSEKGTYTFTYSSPLFDSTLTKTVVVDGRLAVNELEPNYAHRIGETFKVPEIEFFKNGRSVSSRVTVYSPIGEVLELPFVIEDEGYYSVSYDLDSEALPYVKEYLVKKNTASVFSGVETSFAKSKTNNKIKGVNLALKPNEVATFNEIIDLNKFGFDPTLPDLSQNKEFIHFYLQPKTQELPDLDTVFVTLTDVDDPNNFISIRSRYFAYNQGGSVIRTRANGQATYAGYYYNFASTEMSVDNATSHEEGGFVSYLNFGSHIVGEDYSIHGLPLYFDNDAGRLYSRPAWLTGHSVTPGDGYDDRIVPWLVYDYKTEDANLNGGNTPWKGFSSGKVRLSISGKGIANTADLIVTSINGKELSEEFITDVTAPKIEVSKTDFVNNKEDGTYTAPKAKVGNPYKIFDTTTTDDASKIKETVVSVYDPDNNKLPIEGETFVPTKAGQYRIVYEASDVFNNKSTEEVVVNAYGAIPILTLSLNSSLPTSVYFGQELTLPSATYSGGSGNLKLEVSVKSNNGNEVPVNNMKLKVLEPGTSYTVEYKVTDYLGSTKTLTQEINVQISSKVVFDEKSLVLPTAFIHNDVYRFNPVLGSYFDSNYNEKVIQAKISVTDAGGTKVLGDDLTYKPTYSETNNTAIIDVSFDVNGDVTSYRYEVPVVKAKTNTSSYISSFFASENADVTGSSKGLTFASNGNSSMSFEFLKSIESTNLLIDMPLNREKMSFTSIDVELKDMYNANEKVKLTYKYHYDSKLELNRLFVSFNDSEVEYPVNTGIDNSLRISYNAQTHEFIDATGSVIASISTYEDGSEFNGFSSNYTYFSFAANGIESGNFEITVSRINNQSTNLARNDYQEPDIIVNGRIDSRVPAGTVITIPEAICYDVLNNVGELTVNVKTSTGKVILDDTTPNKELQVTLNEYGTYVVTYSVSDSNGNTAERVFVITVYDSVKPELHFDANIPTEVKVGSTITLPKYTITDNNDVSTVNVAIYVFGPDGFSKEVKNGKVTFQDKGTYYITYTATDVNNNVSFYSFKVIAK